MYGQGGTLAAQARPFPPSRAVPDSQRVVDRVSERGVGSGCVMDEGFVTVTPAANGTSAEVKICSPDKAGFGCDLARTMFDFGLTVERGDFSTDGKWSFLMFKVGSFPSNCSVAFREFVLADGTMHLRQRKGRAAREETSL